MKKLRKFFKIKFNWSSKHQLQKLFKEPVDFKNKRQLVMVIVTASIFVYILFLIALFKFPLAGR